MWSGLTARLTLVVAARALSTPFPWYIRRKVSVGLHVLKNAKRIDGQHGAPQDRFRDHEAVDRVECDANEPDGVQQKQFGTDDGSGENALQEEDRA